MKRITKKAYNEANTYMIAIDYLSGKGAEHGQRSFQTWQTVGLKADNLLDAMTETETYHNEDVYMIHLLEKDGKTTHHLDGERIHYKGILATRTKGNFHRQDEAHSESENFGFEIDPEDGADAFTYADFQP